MALQPGQSHSGLPLSQAQQLIQQEADSAHVQQQSNSVQIQQQVIQLPMAVDQQTTPAMMTNILEGGQLHVPIACVGSTGSVSSSSSTCFVRSVHPTNKLKPIPVQNASPVRLASPVCKLFGVNHHQQFVRQLKQGDIQQPVTSTVQQVTGNKVTVVHPQQQPSLTCGLQQISPAQVQKVASTTVTGIKTVKKPIVTNPAMVQSVQNNTQISSQQQAPAAQQPQAVGGDNLAGQTITVEAVDCTPLPGQSRRLIKIVVSGAKGQAHSLLSQNTQLQSQILNMMQKAHTSAAEVTFPSDPEQPIRVTCKPKPDVCLTGCQDSSRKPPLFQRLASSQPPVAGVNHTGGQILNRNNTNSTTTACGVQVQHPTLEHGTTINTNPINNSATPQPKLRTMVSAVSQQITQHSTMQAKLSKIGKGMPTGESYARSVSRDEMNAARGKDKPVGVAAQYINQSPQNVNLQQQLTQSPRCQSTATVQQLVSQAQVTAQQMKSQQSNSSCGATSQTSTQLGTVVHANKESAAIQVMSPGKGGADASQKYIPGNSYIIKCPNGKQIVGLWDGKYFKVKNPLSDTQIAQAKTQKFARASSSIVQHVLGEGDQHSVTASNVCSSPNQVVARTTKDDVQNKNCPRLESQATSTAQESTDSSTSGPGAAKCRKRLSIPKQEGKYAVCKNCGNLSQDYEVCEGCNRPLPEEPKLFAPGSQTTGTQIIALSSNSIDTKQFYANKLAAQAALQKAGVQQTPGKGRGIGRGRGARSARGNSKGRGGNAHAEPDTVTILSSEDEDDTRFPLTRHPGFEKETLVGRKRKMEDEFGRIIPSLGIKRTAAHQSPNVSATKVTEQKTGGNTVIKMVDPIIQLAVQAVRIGTLQTIPDHGMVEFSLKGFHMMLKLPTDAGIEKVLDVRVETREIMEILVSFSKFLVIFLRVTPSCAGRIRGHCGMVQNSEHYFDPNSKLDCHKHLTVLLSEWSSRDQEIFKAVCRKMEMDRMCAQPKILNILPADRANDLLVQASYVGPPKKKPVTTITATQIITQVTTTGVMTSAGLVASPVLINQGGIISHVLHVPGQALPAGHVILTLPPAQKPKPPGDEDEEEEPVDRSRSPSPLLPTFAGPVLRLFTYPPPPVTGGIPVTNEDLFCLNEGEFLNDVIIDFYLKYLVNEILTDEDKERTHVFSSFFYRRLTQKQNKYRSEDQQNMSAMEKRHSRVKTWTRHVDLFQKDFIIVPINESAHWYLAVICFPGLQEPVVGEEPEMLPAGSCDHSPASADKEQDKEKSNTSPESGTSQTESGSSEPSQQANNTKEASKPEASTEPNSNVDKTACSKTKARTRKTVLQPTILIFDSLSGPGRTGVVRTLREYIQVEWNIKKAAEEGPRTFTKENMRGCIPKCPQQTNFSDCGVFVLQYVESFFKTPIRDYSASPMDLSTWFPESCVKQKREELRLLILDLQQELNAELDYDPTQDGCVSVSASAITGQVMLGPVTKDTSQMQTPVIMSAANRTTQDQQGVTTEQVTPNVVATSLPATTVTALSFQSQMALSCGQSTLLVNASQVGLPCTTQMALSTVPVLSSMNPASGDDHAEKAATKDTEDNKQEEQQQEQQHEALEKDWLEEEKPFQQQHLHGNDELKVSQELQQEQNFECEGLQQEEALQHMEVEAKQWQQECQEDIQEDQQLQGENKMECLAESNSEISQYTETVTSQECVDMNTITTSHDDFVTMESQVETLENQQSGAVVTGGFVDSLDQHEDWTECGDVVKTASELREQEAWHGEQVACGNDKENEAMDCQQSMESDWKAESETFCDSQEIVNNGVTKSASMPTEDSV